MLPKTPTPLQLRGSSKSRVFYCVASIAPTRAKNIPTTKTKARIGASQSPTTLILTRIGLAQGS
jgi:hypothetical protein